MTGGSFYPATQYKETAADRVTSLQGRMERLKMLLGEIEADLEKCEKKNWLDYKTLKRLDKAIVVMKVGYKIGKRGLNRDKKHGDPEQRDEPEITETDQRDISALVANMFEPTDIDA